MLIPAVVLMYRVITRWIKREDKITALADNMTHIVENNDRAHQEIITQMRYDRSVTDRRLRWFEEYFMQNGMRLR